MSTASKQVWALLSAAALLGAPVDQGTAPIGTYKEGEKKHWAFQARRNVTPPAFTAAIDKAWVKSPIDGFVLQGLQKEGLRPAPPADRATLIRRVTYDLHGLPPTPEEVSAFVRDRSPKAWEKVIDRLLASPRYGEKWGHHWLDVVRFAESDSYEYDTHRPDAYRYRDYVVRSFNQDKPYDQFVREQLAGDEIDPANEELLVASGFNRLGPLRKNAGNQDVASSRTEVLTEMTNVVGAAFLGMTVGCARCHDHKFDPIRHSDYYRMQGYFAQTHAYDLVQATPEEQAEWKKKAEPLQAQMVALRQQMRRAEADQKLIFEEQIEKLDEQMPPPLKAVYTVRNEPDKLTPIHILERGEYERKGNKVGMRALGILLDETHRELPLATEKPRQKLAEWIVDRTNPLTSRVIVNRIWSYHFGRGIVGTPNDFGRMGTRPSNPDLLDWLANAFIEGGWRMKPMHRMILLSSAYTQSSRSPLEKIAMAKDSENKLLWKFSRRRLEAEEIRDSMLAISGRLNAKMGGPSVLLPIEPELVKMLKRPQYWVTTRDKSEYDRRSLYLIYKRNLRLPFMEVFDAPDMLLSCAKREQSTHAPQALELTNGATSNDLAASLAVRLKSESKTTSGRIDLAWRLTAGRPPTAQERALSLRYLAADPDEPLALKEFALALFNLNAFLYVN